MGGKGVRKVVIARWPNLSTISVLGVSVAVIALLLAGRSAVADNKCKNIAGKARDDFGQMYMTGVFNPDAKRFEAEYHGELCHE
jgi:hypothetical protein